METTNANLNVSRERPDKKKQTSPFNKEKEKPVKK